MDLSALVIMALEAECTIIVRGLFDPRYPKDRLPLVPLLIVNVNNFQARIFTLPTSIGLYTIVSNLISEDQSWDN